MGRPRSWTDDDLRAAVASSSTVSEVVRALRLAKGGGSYVTVRTRMEQLGLRLTPRGEVAEADSNGEVERRRWTEDDLRQAVEAARSLNDVFSRLGLVVGGSQWLVVRSLIIERGWSTDHWDRPLGSPSEGSRGREFRDALSTADVEGIVRRSRSRVEVIRALGFEPGSGPYRWLSEFLRDRGISVAHFEGSHEAMRRSPRRRYRTQLEDILVRGSTYTSLSTLKRRLVEAGLLEHGCAGCGIDDWCGRPISLHLDHINGVRDDHRLENLRFLCPNCHSQTATFCGRNIGRYPATPRDATRS